jgi:excisionase family DNA binding protein
MKDPLGLYSVEAVAQRLGVHVRTVRRYLREGRLRGTKIGKQYRVAAADLARLTGEAEVQQPEPEKIPRHRSCEASAVVQIDAISPEDATRITIGVGAAIKGRDKNSGIPMRVDTVYDETRARLKIIVTGSLSTTSGLLRMIQAYTEVDRAAA